MISLIFSETNFSSIKMIIRDSTGAVKQEVVGELFLFVQDYPYYTYTRGKPLEKPSELTSCFLSYV